jgi:hypothetical protein
MLSLFAVQLLARPTDCCQLSPGARRRGRRFAVIIRELERIERAAQGRPCCHKFSVDARSSKKNPAFCCHSFALQRRQPG